MESIILVLVTGCMCIWSFIIGAKVGQAVKNGEKVETPTVNPMEVYRQHKAKQEAEAEKNRYDTILRNIDSYDGTGSRQEEVPGR
jgi:hypothetical protein